MLQWVCVNGYLESIFVPDPSVDPFSISDMMGDTNPPSQMTLKDYMHPTKSTQPSCITLSALTANFETKSGMIQMLPVF